LSPNSRDYYEKGVPMGFLSKLARLFSPPRPAARYYQFQVKCKRCGEVLDGRVDLYNDPSLDFEEEKTVYFCRKGLVGGGPCYQQVEVTFKFDESRNVLERQVTGGEFVEG
jgi:hypothetical protein